MINKHALSSFHMINKHALSSFHSILYHCQSIEKLKHGIQSQDWMQEDATKVLKYHQSEA